MDLQAAEMVGHNVPPHSLLVSRAEPGVDVFVVGSGGDQTLESCVKSWFVQSNVAEPPSKSDGHRAHNGDELWVDSRYYDCLRLDGDV